VSASNELPADRKLGRYEIVAELGKGAMGTVYKANDPMLERTVALKTIRLVVSRNEMAEYEARFYQEAKAAGGLNHPNIVTIYDVGKTGEQPYLAMEYLEGSELHEVMRHNRPLAPEHALEIAAQVADGLAYAHERGVVHRDIKPANIMVVRDGLVKIADFGVARMRSSERGPDTHVVGSPRYMSPEQVLRKRAEPRSDIFSLGVVLYEMLTGAPPFTGADLNAIMFQIVNANAPPPGTRVSDLPEMLDSIVAKALAKAPENRYQNARDFAAELRECRKQLPATSSLSQLVLPGKVATQKPDMPASQPSGEIAVVAEQDLASDDDEQARTLGVSKEFDSLSATTRLAAETGVLGAFASYINASGAPQAAPPAEVSVPAEPPPAAPAMIASDAGVAWSSKHRLVFGASVALALVVAALIAFA
jgi:eukaryotic-like serine/threonine-protein kinase